MGKLRSYRGDHTEEDFMRKNIANIIFASLFLGILVTGCGAKEQPEVSETPSVAAPVEREPAPTPQEVPETDKAEEENTASDEIPEEETDEPRTYVEQVLYEHGADRDTELIAIVVHDSDQTEGPPTEDSEEKYRGYIALTDPSLPDGFPAVHYIMMIAAKDNVEVDFFSYSINDEGALDATPIEGTETVTLNHGEHIVFSCYEGETVPWGVVRVRVAGDHEAGYYETPLLPTSELPRTEPIVYETPSE